MQPQDIKVLLVEDNPGDARLVQILLDEVEATRFEITHAESLEGAFGRLDAGSFDIILVDLSLPDSSGLQTVERVRNRVSDVAVVVLSGQDDEETALQALEIGAEDYLVKGRDNGEVLARAIRYSMQRKRAEQQLDYLKNYDRLTGLANRSLLRDRLAQAVARVEREESNMLAVLFLSLDRFKAVNAEFGHSCGDAVLRAVGERIRNQIHKGDTVARVGGDEFCLIVEDIEEVHEVISLVTKVLSIFEQLFLVDGQEISVNASIGISVRPPSMSHRLLPEAEFAASRAKSQGSSTYQFYTEEMNVQAFERLTLENSLRRALEREEFTLHYQPQVDLVTGSVVGVEALLRWRHSEMGLVPPVRFIPVLEETGLIFDVGEWVIHTACEQAKRWAETDFGPLRVAVNISARQFEREDLVETTSQCLNDTGLPSGCLELELTESIIMADPEKSRAMLERLKSGKEVRVSIDDFGTGYSSLSYLKLFALDALKVDKSFVQDVHDAENTAAIVSTIIRLGHDLGLDIVAEGVELEEQLDFLCESGCDQAQGYYFSAPVPADDFTRLLKSEKPLPGFE